MSKCSVTSPTSQLILQPLRCFTYVTVHSPTLPLLHLRHSSFSNLPVASPMSQFILQPFFRFSYVTSSSLNSPGEPSMTQTEDKFRRLFFLRKSRNRLVKVTRQSEWKHDNPIHSLSGCGWLIPTSWDHEKYNFTAVRMNALSMRSRAGAKRPALPMMKSSPDRSFWAPE